MGFVRKSLRLVFDDPELEGLEVGAKRLSVSQLFDVMELKHLAGADDMSPEVREGVEKAFGVLSGALTRWNLEEPVDATDPDGPTRPVELTSDALMKLDFGLVMSIINAIQQATTGVSRPLDPTSSGGVPSLELSLPMEPLSENP